MNQPLLDAHYIRQCQTAAATRSILSEPGFPVSSTIPWAGDINARYVLELPLYNYLVIAVHQVAGDLDRSGKITSILLWAISFVILQFIWRRLLERNQTLWANLLFVIAPLGVFYGQAFMPEMLVQVLAFWFLVAILRYAENPHWDRWLLCAGIGMVGLLVKLPAFSHLYLVLAAVLFSREGFKCLFRPRYLIAAVLTAIAVKAWSGYVDSVNMPFLPEWTSRENLRGFIGTVSQRFEFKPWAMAALYVTVFILPGPAILAAAYGLWRCLRRDSSFFLRMWLLSVAVFYVLWFGNAASRQSYYNLPALGVLSALFGLSVSGLLDHPRMRRWSLLAGAAAVFLTILPAIPVYSYLFRQDPAILAAANWLRAETRPGDVILFRPNHHWSAIDYPYNPALAYYSQRPTFVWTRHTPEAFRQAALSRSRYAVVTLPPPPPSGAIAALNRFRNVQREPEPIDWLAEAGFQPMVATDRFIAFARKQDANR